MEHRNNKRVKGTKMCIRGLTGLTGGFPWLQIFSVAISVSLHVNFILDLILNSMFLR